jgi:hypothetical protein
MIVVTAALIGGVASATLPAPSDAVKAKAAETAAKSAWSDKVALYQLCLSQDRTAEAYRRAQKAAGKPVPAPVTAPPCADPGPYVAQAPASARPLEASGAHSPPETATAPPSSRATAAQINGKK